MANRILRDWTDSEAVDKISANAEVFFTRLIMKADDFGCYHANPKLLKAALFPLKDIREADISRWMTECQTAGLIALYQEAGKKYLFIKEFRQRMRQMTRKFPDPSNSPPPVDGQLADNSPLEGNRKEIEGEGEKKGPEFDFDFVDEKFTECFFRWIQFRKDKKEPFKLQVEVEGAYRQVIELSGNDSVKAAKIIKESIDKGWKHLYALKTEEKPKAAPVYVKPKAIIDK